MLKSSLPLVSIIIPTFNSEEKLQRCINSIKCQTYSEVEVLVVDGRSTDATLEILEVCKKDFKNLKYISESDQGIYDAMNKGAMMATGEWLYFLGSDDYLYSSSVIEEIFSNKELINNDVLYGDVWNENINAKYDGEFSYEKLTRKFICHQSIFIKRKVFLQFGPYNIRYSVSADMAFTLKTFGNPNVRWKYVNNLIAYYSSGGYSAGTYDKEFWNDAECLYLNCLSGFASKTKIYKALLPVIKYDFGLNKLGLLFKIVFYTRSVKPLGYVFYKFYRVGVLTFRKVVK